MVSTWPKPCSMTHTHTHIYFNLCTAVPNAGACAPPEPSGRRAQVGHDGRNARTSRHSTGALGCCYVYICITWFKAPSLFEAHPPARAQCSWRRVAVPFFSHFRRFVLFVAALFAHLLLTNISGLTCFKLRGVICFC